MFETLNIFICSAPPLALLYSDLLFEGKERSLTIIPSILNATALLIIDPIFLGSVTSSKAIKLRFFFSDYRHKGNFLITLKKFEIFFGKINEDTLLYKFIRKIFHRNFYFSLKEKMIIRNYIKSLKS